MAEEDEQRLFTEKINKTFSECLNLINEVVFYLCSSLLFANYFHKYLIKLYCQFLDQLTCQINVQCYVDLNVNCEIASLLPS